ncbi:MAG: phosphatase PAP2 family protein [Chloroflexi bacterium]|nr:MAG: phosphatase PAP2 family protein [Chloroflexota bacterium]
MVALAVAIVWWRARRPRWWLPLLIAAVVAIETALKLIVPQAPPPHELSRSIQLLPFLESPTPYSFPSGHVARVAFLVLAFGWRWPVALACVFVMAITRVYLGDAPNFSRSCVDRPEACGSPLPLECIGH